MVPLLYITFATHRSLVQLKLPCVHALHMHDGKYIQVYVHNSIFYGEIQFMDLGYFAIYMDILLGRQTGASALLFNATYVCTLQFTIGFNYLTLLQLGTWSASEFAVPDCAFKNVTGTMDVVPVLGSSFFIFFPAVMAVVVIIFVFRLHLRILKLCGVTQDSTMTTDDKDALVADGVALIREHKNLLINRQQGRQHQQAV